MTPLVQNKPYRPNSHIVLTIDFPWRNAPLLVISRFGIKHSNHYLINLLQWEFSKVIIHKHVRTCFSLGPRTPFSLTLSPHSWQSTRILRSTMLRLKFLALKPISSTTSHSGHLAMQSTPAWLYSLYNISGRSQPQPKYRIWKNLKNRRHLGIQAGNIGGFEVNYKRYCCLCELDVGDGAL